MTGLGRSGKHVSLAAEPQRASASGPSVEEVYEGEVAFVWRTIRYLGVPLSDAEDVAHDVFIVVQRRLADYDPSQRLRPWIAGITRNVVLHYKRSRARIERKVAAMEPAAESEPPQELDEMISRQQAAAILESFLRALDDDKRDVFVMCELEGLSAPEAAEILGVSVNTVYSRLRAGRQLFQKRVDRIDRVRRREGG